MQDSEQEYPLHQPHTRSGSRHVFEGDDDQLEEDISTPRRPLRQRAGGIGLPRNRFKNALTLGVIAGLLGCAQGIIITIANAPTYHAYDIASDPAVKSAIASTIFGYTILIFVLNVLICLVAGFIAGRIAVERRLGFLVGFIAGLIICGVELLTHYIPGYPGNQAASGLSNAQVITGGIIVLLILFFIYVVILGLISLLGAWIATRRHPHYAGI